MVEYGRHARESEAMNFATIPDPFGSFIKVKLFSLDFIFQNAGLVYQVYLLICSYTNTLSFCHTYSGVYILHKIYFFPRLPKFFSFFPPSLVQIYL